MLEVKETAFYTVPEISAGLNIAVSGVRSWIRQGKLKARENRAHLYNFRQRCVGILTSRL
jgi:predicted site-specific integrase-resolvase